MVSRRVATKRGTPKRRKKVAPKKSTALVRRDSQLPTPKVDVLPPDPRMVGDGMLLGDLGLVEVKLTPDEEECLSAPVPVDAVKILPTGMVYAPHTEYTKLFNKAFGRLGWSIVPVGKPALAQQTVVCPYILFIHGRPVALAQGEQEFFDSNRGQSYGDALESTVASAMRRCAKRIGVWLELWDRRWSEAFVEQHGVKVWCEVTKRGSDEKERKPQWRLKTDPPFWNEQDRPARRREEPAAGHNPDDNKPITREQRERLVTIANRAGRTVPEVSVWLAARFNVQSSAQLKRRDYDVVCRAIAQSGPLPVEA